MGDAILSSREKRFVKAFHRDGAVICNGCDGVLELADCDGVDEAIERFNDHVEAAHV